MQGFDGTGPVGQGQITGGSLGPCGMGLGRRKRFGVHRGMGRYFGCRRWPQSSADKTQALEEYKLVVEKELENVNQELKDLSLTE